MARYTLPSGDPRFFGSRGGSTFQRSGKVFSIRKRNVPVQKKSIRQSENKNVFGAYASRWQELSGAQKTTWTTNSPDYPRTDSLGNSYNVKGQALRVGANIVQFPNGASIINTLVAAIAPSAITRFIFVFDRASSNFVLQINPTNVQTNCQLVYFVGRPAPTEIEFQKSDLTLLGIRDSGQSTGTPNWFVEYTAIFPVIPPVDVWLIPVIAEVVQKSSGQVIFTLKDYAQILF